MSSGRYFFNLGYRFISSFGLAVATFVLLLIITYLGTVAQIEIGLLKAQQVYFESWFFIEDFAYFKNNMESLEWLQGKAYPKLLLPGGKLLLVVLFFNLLIGGIIRLRKKWHKPGLIISHFSIVVLLVGSFVEYRKADRGNLKLDPKQTADYFTSYYDWDIEITKAGAGPGDEALVIPYEQINYLEGDLSRTFRSDKLPFDVQVSNYVINSQPNRATASPGAGPAAKGYYLEVGEEQKEAEMNVGGCKVSLLKPGTSEPLDEGILWGLANAPMTAEVGGQQFLVTMVRRIWPLPFAVRLDQFEFDLHPMTRMAREYTSTISQIEDGAEKTVIITMNEPMRDEGYVLYQSGYGPDNAQPGDPNAYTVLAVADNPADYIPMISCIMVGIGLLIHFIQMMVQSIGGRARNESPAAAAAAATKSAAGSSPPMPGAAAPSATLPTDAPDPAP